VKMTYFDGAHRSAMRERPGNGKARRKPPRQAAFTAVCHPSCSTAACGLHPPQGHYNSNAIDIEAHKSAAQRRGGAEQGQQAELIPGGIWYNNHRGDCFCFGVSPKLPRHLIMLRRVLALPKCLTPTAAVAAKVCACASPGTKTTRTFVWELVTSLRSERIKLNVACAVRAPPREHWQNRWIVRHLESHARWILGLPFALCPARGSWPRGSHRVNYEMQLSRANRGETVQDGRSWPCNAPRRCRVGRGGI